MQLSFLAETNMTDPDIRSLIFLQGDRRIIRTMTWPDIRSLIFLQQRWVGFYQGQ